MSEVFLFNIEPKKSAEIKRLCSMFGIGYRSVEPEDFGKKLGCLLGVIDDGSAINVTASNVPASNVPASNVPASNVPASNVLTSEGSFFDDEMLYLVDIDGGLLDILLFQLRKRKLSVALKAVKTDTNIHYTSYELFRELSAEREAIRNYKTAH